MSVIVFYLLTYAVCYWTTTVSVKIEPDVQNTVSVYVMTKGEVVAQSSMGGKNHHFSIKAAEILKETIKKS